MTRVEHINWCKERAIKEFDYYHSKEGLAKATQNGITSMMSDLNKHDDTKGPALQSLCMMTLMGNLIRSRQEFVNFINGFR